jgi:putative toxin-antitoxin system antitoxin component (TIGR02293 family)
MSKEAYVIDTMGLIDALGGRKTFGRKVRKEDDLVEQIRKGLPFSAMEYLRSILDLPRDDMSDYLGMTLRTLQRRQSQKVFGMEESAKIIRLARVYLRAKRIMGSQEDAVAWLRHDSVTLNNKSPLDLMDTPIGEEKVHALLSRIEYGVYS